MKRLVALASLFAVFTALAIEPPKEPPAPAQPGAKTEPAKPDGGSRPPVDDSAKPAEAAPEGEDEEELPPLPPDAVPAGPPPQRFTPTEKVRADFPVSFPIDI